MERRRGRTDAKVKKRQRRMKMSCAHTELTGYHCRLWHKRAVCRHVRPPHGATDTQRVQEGREESKRRLRSSLLRPRGTTAWSPHYRLQTEGKRI